MKDKILEAIVRERKSQGIKQAEMAKALGISQPTYSKIESGEAGLTTVRMVKIIETLGCHAQVFSSRDEILWDSRGYNDGSSE